MQKVNFQNGLKKILWLRKLKILFFGNIFLAIITIKKIIGTFYEKELAKKNKKEFRIEKVIKRKGDKLYVKWILLLRIEYYVIKKVLLYKSELFSTLWLD